MKFSKSKKVTWLEINPLGKCHESFLINVQKNDQNTFKIIFLKIVWGQTTFIDYLVSSAYVTHNSRNRRYRMIKSGKIPFLWTYINGVGEENRINKFIRKYQTLERVWRKGNPLTLLMGMQTSTATMENSVEIP